MEILILTLSSLYINFLYYFYDLMYLNIKLKPKDI